MDVFFPRTPHISEQIFAQMDKANLAKCRKVAKSWQEYIDRNNLPWIQINIPKIHLTLRSFKKNTYLHIAARYGQTNVFKEIFKSIEIKNPRNGNGETPFHLIYIHGHVNILMQNITELNVNEELYGITPFMMACTHGQVAMVKVLVEKSAELNIDLNAKDRSGFTAFHWACFAKKSNIVEFFIQKSIEFNIELNTKDELGRTPFILACIYDRIEVVKILMQNSTHLAIDFNAKDGIGRTAFHWACCHRRGDVVEIMIIHEKSLKLDLKAKDNNGETGFQIARRF